jgi:hypothetical protein
VSGGRVVFGTTNGPALPKQPGPDIQEVSPGCTITLTADDLAFAASALPEAVKNRSYRALPLGLEVARYVRWKRSEWGAADNTMLAYEAVLAKRVVFFADLELAGRAADWNGTCS